MQRNQASDNNHTPLRNIKLALSCCALGLLFSVSAGLYVAAHMQGISTYLAMQALVVYSFPYVLLAAIGFTVYHAKRIKLHAQIFTVGSVILLLTTLIVTFGSLGGAGDLAQRLDDANITAFNFELIVAILMCATLLIAAKLSRS